MTDLIGKIVKIRTPFYNIDSKKTEFKSRPELVIGNYGSTDNDYIVLPISKVSNKRMRHPEYDLAIDPSLYPLAHLTSFSYIRCHKQATINRTNISNVICDFKELYENKYIETLLLLEKFDKEKLTDAL
ncbi:MAG: type II toxin-antitoxin system PemK/MazF family toxin [Erysipelotrichaceae bacterium]|nr:type II toxin-antitoxin system PemK/MazF family toxin [Erysipelotrichaceae bacterium]